MLTYAYEYPSYYEVNVTDGTEINSFTYQFNKGQDIETSIEESIRLAEFEIDRRNPVPISV